MNTNTNGLPNIELLEKLANELFSASSNINGDKKKYPLVTYDNLNALEQNNTESYIPQLTTNEIPKSLAGSGISPSANENAFNINDPQTSLPDPHFINNVEVPKSRTGSGLTPSALKSESKVNTGYTSYLNNQNYLQEISPLLNTKSIPSFDNTFPDNFSNPLDSEVKKILNSINVSFPSPQLPFEQRLSTNESSFYFFESKSSLINSKKGSMNALGLGNPTFDANIIKRDFPILNEKVNGKPLIWLDNAATTQKPKQVIDRISYFYEHENSNIHRAAHELAARATDAYEEARKKVQHFINAGSINEIVFVRGTTEAINLVSKSWGEQYLSTGDEIIISHLEHHANIVPWQQLAAKKGLILRVIPVDDNGQILIEEYAKLLNSKTKLVSFTQVSNALGTVTPAKLITEMAHATGAKVLVDGAQSVSHMRTNVQDINADWFVFSGHKVFGPTGIGVLYGKEELLNQTQPWQGGGNMIKDVTFEYTQYHDAPSRFEAGTGNIADAVGLGAAIDYVNKIGIEFIHQYEHYLLVYATNLLKEVPGLRLIGTAKEKASVLSFVLKGYQTEEIGTALNKEGIAVRSGHHCAQPILRRFGLESTVRPSLAFYNTCSDIDTLVSTLHSLSSIKR